MVHLALAWVLRRKEMTSALVGVRTLDQLKDNLGVLANLDLRAEESAAIDEASRGALLQRHPLQR
jgi:L-glyceraldehyde 3-phosphate reductase